MPRRDVRDRNHPAIQRVAAGKRIRREKERRVQIRKTKPALPRRETRGHGHRQDRLDVAAYHEAEPLGTGNLDYVECGRDAAEASAVLSSLLGREVTLWPLRPAEDTEHYRRGTPDNPDMFEELRELFGREEGEPMPDLSVFPPEIMEFTSPLGTYFDAFPLHFLTTATLAEMTRLAPDSAFDPRRFRPNFVVETTADAGQGLIEAAWSGSDLKIGEARIRALMPTVRCSVIAQPQGDLAKDPGVLRAVVREADQNLGSYATIVEAGTIRVGDEVVLLD